MEKEEIKTIVKEALCDQVAPAIVEALTQSIKGNVDLTRLMTDIKASSERTINGFREELHSAKARCEALEALVTELRGRCDRLQDKYDSLHDTHDKLLEKYEHLAERSLDKSGTSSRADVKVNV